jgi:hypothetical protein
MKEKLAKLIDVKSIATLAVIADLIFLVDYCVVTGNESAEKLVILFTNVVTAIVTYFFTKKKSDNNAD